MQVYVIQQDSTTPFPKEQEWRDGFYYAKDFVFHYLSGDADIHKHFSNCRPDVIVTIGATIDKLPNMYRLPYWLKRRWLNYDHVDIVQPWFIRSCFITALQEQVGPEVSVYMVAEGSDGVQGAYQSLAAQVDTDGGPFREWELVIVDNSNDELKTWNETLVPLADSDCRVRLYRGWGVNDPMRDAATLCRAESIVSLEQDNRLTTDTLSRVRDAFRAKPNARTVPIDGVYTRPCKAFPPMRSKFAMFHLDAEPNVSIFTTCYKSQDKILRPFESLMKQVDAEGKKFDDWEWVMIDDSPNDETLQKFLIPLTQKDKRIRLYKGKHNDGFIGAMKRDAASLCHGNYLVELDHDDRLMPLALFKVAKSFRENKHLGMVGSDCIELYENSTKTRCYGDNYGCGHNSYYKQWIQDLGWVNVARNGALDYETLRHIVGILNHLRAWTRECYADIGRHDWRLYVCDDYDLVLRCFAWNKYPGKRTIGKIPEMLYIQYCNAGGDNFTNHRNHYIQTLVAELRSIHEETFHAKLLELGMEDPLYKQPFKLRDGIRFEGWDFLPSGDEFLIQDKDTIHVIVPTSRNQCDLLVRALKSILRQTYTNFIIWIIGDKDVGLDACMQEEPCMRDPRIRYWNLADNRKSGTYSRNYVLHTLVATKGAIVALLDNDNQYLSTKHLESLHTALETPFEDGAKPAFAFSSFIFEEKGQLTMRIRCSEPKLYRVDTSCLMVRTELFAKYGYFRPEKVCGYAIEHFLVDMWVKGGERWKATNEYSMAYLNTNQNAQAIRNVYPDQEGVGPVSDEEKKAYVPINVSVSKSDSRKSALQELAERLASEFEDACVIVTQAMEAKPSVEPLVIHTQSHVVDIDDVDSFLQS